MHRLSGFSCGRDRCKTRRAALRLSQARLRSRSSCAFVRFSIPRLFEQLIPAVCFSNADIFISSSSWLCSAVSFATSLLSGPPAATTTTRRINCRRRRGIWSRPQPVPGVHIHVEFLPAVAADVIHTRDGILTHRIVHRAVRAFPARIFEPRTGSMRWPESAALVTLQHATQVQAIKLLVCFRMEDVAIRAWPSERVRQA